jgi:hypothetical protein
MATMFFTSARDKFRLDATEVQQVASLHLSVPAFFLILTGVFEGAGGVALVLGAYARVAAAAGAIHAIRLARLCQVLVVQGTSGSSHDDEKHLRRQRRDNRRTDLPRRTRPRRSRADGL